MNIYFGGSISGGRQYLAVYQDIVAHLKDRGHHVLTEHVVRADVLEFEENFTAEEIYTRDMEWLKACDCLIAEVSNPSLGVGYEISYALHIGKPVLCIYREGVFLTRMLTGNTGKGLTVKTYNDTTGRRDIVDDFLHVVAKT